MNEVKRQAMDEVQKAVAEAEQKAFEMIAAERAKMEKTLAEAKRKAQEDAILVINEQEDSSEVRRVGWYVLYKQTIASNSIPVPVLMFSTTPVTFITVSGCVSVYTLNVISYFKSSITQYIDFFPLMSQWQI